MNCTHVVETMPAVERTKRSIPGRWKGGSAVALADGVVYPAVTTSEKPSTVTVTTTFLFAGRLDR